MDNKAIGSKSKSFAEHNYQDRAKEDEDIKKDNTSSLQGIQDKSSLLSSPAKRGRPVKDKETDLLLSHRFLGINQKAINYFSENICSPIDAYKQVGSVQLASCDPFENINGFFRYLYSLQQIKFSGYPKPGDFLFVSHGNLKLHLIHSYFPKENVVCVFDRKEDGSLSIEEIHSFYCFGWIS